MQPDNLFGKNFRDSICRKFSHSSTGIKIAKDTVIMALGLTGRVFAQIAYFLIVARTLEPEAYGAFAGALALVTVFSPFVSWGSQNILIKNVSRQSDLYQKYFGMALSVSVVTAFLLTIISVVFAWFILSPTVALTIVLPLACGVYFGDGISTLAGSAFQARQIISRTSILGFLSGFFRVLGSILLLFLPVPKTAETWAILYMFCGLLLGLIGLVWVKKEIRLSFSNLSLMRGNWREGFYFAISLSSQGVYNDIDKTLLLRLASDSIAGLYSAAYRVMDATFIPVRAMLTSTYARFFKLGEQGTKTTSNFALRLLPWAAGWGILVGLGLLIGAPLLVSVLGNQYAETAKILLWLSPLPLLRAFHYLAADSLTGSGYQQIRSISQIGIAIINLGLNLLLIPRFSWLGAAWSSLISDGLLAVSLWAINLVLIKKQSNLLAG